MRHDAGTMIEIGHLAEGLDVNQWSHCLSAHHLLAQVWSDLGCPASDSGLEVDSEAFLN